MIDLHTLKQLDVEITGGQETHPTAGYRRWRGLVKCSEPIVALSLIETNKQISWVRSSYAKDEQEIGILFTPRNESGDKVSVSLSVGNSVVCEKTTLNNTLLEPNPIVGSFKTGSFIKFADIESKNSIILKVLFLSKEDVKVGRNGIWHLKTQHINQLNDVWRKVFSFGRTGVIEK